MRTMLFLGLIVARWNRCEAERGRKDRKDAEGTVVRHRQAGGKKQRREPRGRLDEGRAVAIASPGSTSAVMGCMIYVVGVWCAHFQQPPFKLPLRARTMTEVH